MKKKSKQSWALFIKRMKKILEEVHDRMMIIKRILKI